MKALVVVFLVGCGSGSATTRRETLDSIPRAAGAALRRAASGAHIESIEREGERYEASWQVGGLEHGAAVTAAGELVELEEEVASTQVPPRVRAAAIAKLAGAQSIKFVKLTLTGNYEAEAIVDGREMEASFAPDGRSLPSETNVDSTRVDP